MKKKIGSIQELRAHLEERKQMVLRQIKEMKAASDAPESHAMQLATRHERGQVYAYEQSIQAVDELQHTFDEVMREVASALRESREHQEFRG